MTFSHVSIFFILIVGSIIIVSSILIIKEAPITYGLDAKTTTAITTTTTTSMQKDPSCQNLYSVPNSWAHTYNHQRFKTHSPDCITVKGTVLSASPPGTSGGEPDGDFHFNILADTATYSNKYNCKTQPAHGSCQELIVEIICYDHKAITLPAAQTSCAGYKNDIKGPKQGDHVTVTGKWVEDYGIPGDIHQWNEIHPVTKLTIP